MQLLVKDDIGVPIVQHYEEYLDLPSFVGRKKWVFQQHKTTGMEEVAGMGKKTFITSEGTNTKQGGDSSFTHIYNVLL